MKHKISFKKFNNYSSMSQSAKRWDIHCAYQFSPQAFIGENFVIELPSMQLAYSHREGGYMQRTVSPKDSISITVVQECKGVASFDRMKVSKGDIVFFDDKKAYNFMSKNKTRVAIVSIPNTTVKHLQSALHAAVGHYIKDNKGILAIALQKILEEIIKNNSSLDLQKIEDEIVALLTNLFETESPKIAKLTKGEKTVLDILEQLYGHMDGNVSIVSLAKQYSVSQHTLEKSFKSLFGFTPKRFLLILKINHVHYDLKHADPASCTVSRIAQKWGFSHMGRFSGYYTDLFGENPSVTLRREQIQDESMTTECASRQEEIV
jgi:AraC-like DNA-binding protein